MATLGDRRRGPSEPPQLKRRRRSGRYRWTAEQFAWLGEAGVFDDGRVELLDGELYEMTINPPHATATGLASQVLQAAFGPGYVIREQKPLDLGRRSAPEPDVAVVVGSLRDYNASHPTGALLVVEISDTTLRKDRTLKAHIYAAAGIEEYWIVNLVDRQLEVHRRPGADPARRGRFRYAEITMIGPDGHAAPLGAPAARVAVADLLP